METHVRSWVVLIALAIALAPDFATATTPEAAPEPAPYELVLLANADFGDEDEATAINAQGTALGTSCTSFSSCQPIIWTASGEAIALATPRYRDTWLPAINDEGLIAGSIEVEPDKQIAALWLDAGEYTTLRTPDGSPGMAMVINNEGQIAGVAMKPNGAMRLVLWEDRQPAWLNPSPDLSCSLLLGMNDSAVIVGMSSDDCEVMHAVMWDANGLTHLPNLNLDATPDPDDWLQWQSAAWAINESHTIVGFALDTDAQHAVMWQDGEIMVLQELPGTIGCAAFGINDGGTVVGQCFRDMATSQPVVWIDGMPAELPGGDGVAYGINNDGIVVGHVVEGDGTRAAMWIPETGFSPPAMAVGSSCSNPVYDPGRSRPVPRGDGNGVPIAGG